MGKSTYEVPLGAKIVDGVPVWKCAECYENVEAEHGVLYSDSVGIAICEACANGMLSVNGFIDLVEPSLSDLLDLFDFDFVHGG